MSTPSDTNNNNNTLSVESQSEKSMEKKGKDHAKKQRTKLSDMFHSLTPQISLLEYKEILGQEIWMKNYDIPSDHQILVTSDEDGNKYMNANEINDYTANILAWNNSKKEAQLSVIRELCYSSPISTVSTKELLHLILNDGSFGVEHCHENDMPARLQIPDFTSLDVWVLKTPDRISYAQLKVYYNDYYKFYNFEHLMDEKFFQLQQSAFKKIDKALKKKKSSERLEQLRETPVAFSDFYNIVFTEICDSNPENWLFETNYGKQIKAQSTSENVATTNVTWKEVFVGIWSMRPMINSISDAVWSVTLKSDNQNNNLDSNSASSNSTSSDLEAGSAKSTAKKTKDGVKKVAKGTGNAISDTLTSSVTLAQNALASGTTLAKNSLNTGVTLASNSLSSVTGMTSNLFHDVTGGTAKTTTINNNKTISSQFSDKIKSAYHSVVSSHPLSVLSGSVVNNDNLNNTVTVENTNTNNNNNPTIISKVVSRIGPPKTSLDFNALKKSYPQVHYTES